MFLKEQQEYDRLLKYLKNNEHRMDYSRYLKQGWQMGSGAIALACKRVVNPRVCLEGMRWGEAGAAAAAHLRAIQSIRATPTNGKPSGHSPLDAGSYKSDAHRCHY